MTRLPLFAKFSHADFFFLHPPHPSFVQPQKKGRVFQNRPHSSSQNAHSPYRVMSTMSSDIQSLLSAPQIQEITEKAQNEAKKIMEEVVNAQLKSEAQQFDVQTIIDAYFEKISKIVGSSKEGQEAVQYGQATMNKVMRRVLQAAPELKKKIIAKIMQELGTAAMSDEDNIQKRCAELVAQYL